MLIINHQEPISKFNNFLMTEEVNGLFEVSFTSFDLDNPGHELIEEESIISVDGYDFKVKQLKEIKNRKSVVAVSTFYDLVGHIQHDIYGGTHTFNEFANFIFNGTGWTFTSDVTGSRLIPNFGTDNVIKLVQGLCQVYECEFKIMPNNHIHFSDKIGGDNDAQYRYGHNVKALSKSVDTTNLRTKIKGYGADNLVVTYTSPNAEVFGVIESEPIHDDNFAVGEDLAEHIKRQLNDYPEVSLELDVAELTDKELGERVWLIYEPLGIEFQTRILAKKSVMRNSKLVTGSVILGNSIPKNTSDILASQKIEIDENKKQVMSRIEQTNDRISFEVEEIDESLAAISLQADNIQLSVSDLSGRMGNAESQISIQAGEISQKVSRTDYNGETLVSMINQTPSSVKIQAKNITLQGAVTVLSELSNDLGTITAGNINIYSQVGIGNRLHLRTGGQQTIQFGDDGTGAIHYNSGSLTFNSLNPVTVTNDLDMTNKNIINAGNIIGYAKGHTNGIGIAHSPSSNRLYVRINGSDVGYVQLT